MFIPNLLIVTIIIGEVLSERLACESRMIWYDWWLVIWIMFPTIQSGARLEINDLFEGELLFKGTLYISSRGKVVGRVVGKKVVVEGVLEGAVEGEVVEVCAGGRVSGEVMTRELVVHEGAAVEGCCSVGMGSKVLDEAKDEASMEMVEKEWFWQK